MDLILARGGTSLVAAGWRRAVERIDLRLVAGGAGVPAQVPAPLQPYLAGLGRGGGWPDGAERLVVPADAGTVGRQCARGAGAPPLWLGHGRL